MTPGEITLLQEAGSGIYLATIQWICICLLFGIYGFLAIFAVYLVAHSPWTKNMSQYILIICLGLGAIAMIFSITISFIASFLVNSAAQKSLQVMESQVALYAAGGKWSDISSWASTIMVCLDDFMIAWRAYCIWTGRANLSPLFGFFMSAYFGLQIYANVQTSHPLLGNILIGVSTLTLNIFGTALIGLKTWVYQKHLKKQGMRYHTLTPSQKILLTWLESGCFFCMLEGLWVLDVCLSTTATGVPVLSAIVQGIQAGVLALYPVIVFIMAKLQLSATEQIISLRQPSCSMDGQLL
jgi:hypothetical protein